MKLVIIGGGASGSEAALEARKFDRNVEITLIEKQKYPQYSLCGLPYALSGDVDNFDNLIIFPKEFYEKQKINLVLDKEIKQIDAQSRKVRLSDGSEIEFDSLILATGAIPCNYKSGFNYPEGIFFIRTLEDSINLAKKIDSSKKAIIYAYGWGCNAGCKGCISGRISLEMAYALKKRKLDVTIVSKEARPLRQQIDSDMSELIIHYLKSKGINLISDKDSIVIAGEDKVKGLIVDNELIGADIIVMASGTRTNSSLAKECGIEIQKGIKTNPKLETSIEKIYACGDCASIKYFFTGENFSSSLGTNAVRSGKIAGINSVGGNLELDPLVNIIIMDFFDLKIGAFGLTEDDLSKLGKEYVKARYKGKSKAEYYPGNKDIVIKILASKEGDILGFQAIGEEGVFARTLAVGLAVQKGIKIKDLAKFENCYSPPISPTIDPVQICAELVLKRLR
ncbi:MAG: Coenzyme A disulfide reductase [Candidatus Methanofastidiosum methylothiophilum]|uniref:Coenzyme A disulfide reductase n=1 Tax=Candidatus Methanofastidiosum methylothiophilum TaxID=1705564 RepID=A0A150IZW9_9EURY|nr:MAG: Coenzyme A disulfide reductase [Candidatus Methanofastidiosum methylthiophilus]KYC48061.1 MAG: Coenzyme A disulfide reductase [Candidatus Methanofastidiosum methylthiophilus]KYC50452.1 MAG: Coenzyme A disulfide reductase [Candidatus Methanofastidiosum methylthiophilus]